VQSHYVKRIAIVGAESTGKTTLAEKLARHFNTAWVPEFARIYLDQKNAGKNAINVAEKDFPIIARGQLRSEEKMARYAQKILFCDTEVRTTAFWSEIFLGHCPDIVSKLALKKQYDLYLLTTNDVPWTNDPQRNHRHLRDAFFHNWHKELDSMNANYTLLSGAYQQRFQQASKAVNSLFKKFPSALKKNLII
jgi:NadR type nicotinamide-nucleotide adenylyltransferase